RMTRPGQRRPQRPGVWEADTDLFALHWQAHYDHGDLLVCLRSLRGEQLGTAAHEMLGYVARMPLTEVVRFARELDWEDELRGGRQTRACWSGTSEAAALVAALADRTDADVGAVLQALLDRPHPAGLDRPHLATTELLSAISAYSNDVIVTVAMGLNSAVPSL